MNVKLIAATLFSLIILFYNLGKTNIAGAPAGHSGAPGEGNCTSCHAGQPILQSPNLMVSFRQFGVPVQSILRGQTYQVKVRINGSNHNYGFQFSAKNPATGLPVGFFNTFNGTGPIGSSIQHNQFGTTSNIPNGREWSFEFVTPSTYQGDSIVFYVAGMLGNQDGQVTGDQVLLQSYRFAVSSGSGPTPPSVFWNNSPSQICQGTTAQPTFTASGTFDTTSWIYLEFSKNDNQFLSPIVLDSIKAKPTNQGQFSFNPDQLPLGNHFIRIIERGNTTVSTNRPITILGIDTPKLDYWDASQLIGSSAAPIIELIGGNKPLHNYQWSFNGSPINVPANADYTLANPFGFYRVRATHQLCTNIPAVTGEYEFTPFSKTFYFGHVCLPFFQCGVFPLIRNRTYNARTMFYLELSDSTGNFSDTPRVLYSFRLQSVVNAFLWWGLPNNLNPNGQYRLRGKTTSPDYYSPQYSLFTVSHTPDTPIIVNNNGILQVTNPSARVRWIRKESGVVPLANSASFFPLISGTYIAQQYDGNCYSNWSNEISIIFTGTQELSLPIRLSPNPANQEVVLESEQDLDHAQVSLLDINGRMLQPILHQETANRIRIETSALPNGLYILQHQNKRAKLMVQH